MMWEWCTGLGWIWMLVVWVVIIGAVVWVVTQLSAGNRTPQGGPSEGRRILDERFARGEIDEDEYRRIQDELSS